MNHLARFAGLDWQGPDDPAGPQQPPEGEPGAGSGLLDPQALREPIIEALRRVYDPEIPVNIYDLGLIYRIDIGERGEVSIDMTLTAPACPVAGMMPVMVEDAVRTVEGVAAVQVELVWDPPWDMDSMSDEARLQLGLL